MRITGGFLRNRIVSMRTPKGIRPTASRVREALFSILGQDLSEKTFLDAFGGSGIIGMEAFSRGAVVTICEKRKGAYLSIKTLLEKEVWDIDVFCASAETKLDKKWDIIFMDPPYSYEPLPWIQKAEAAIGSILVFEHASVTLTPDRVGALYKSKGKKYGDCSLSFYEPIVH